MAKLRCRIAELEGLASRYEYDTTDLAVYAPEIKSRGYLTKADLKAVADWKSPRSAGHVAKNDDGFVREITRTALSAKNERTRIEVLTLLDGVQWPTASVILHFFHRGMYPIVDFRALWSISLEVPNQYTFGFWWDYVCYCRDLARTSHMSMRALDMALWQYSKENQA